MHCLDRRNAEVHETTNTGKPREWGGIPTLLKVYFIQNHFYASEHSTSCDATTITEFPSSLFRRWGSTLPQLRRFPSLAHTTSIFGEKLETPSLFRSPLLTPRQFTLHIIDTTVWCHWHSETLSPSIFDLFWGKWANHIALHTRNWHWRNAKFSASQFQCNWYDDT